MIRGVDSNLGEDPIDEENKVLGLPDSQVAIEERVQEFLREYGDIPVVVEAEFAEAEEGGE